MAQAHGASGCIRGDCASCGVRQTTELCSLSARGLRSLEGARKPASFAAGALVADAETGPRGIWALTEGFVAMHAGDGAGRSVLVRVFGPGETFGHAAMCAPIRPDLRAEALTDVHVCFLPRSAANRLLRLEPDVAVALTERLAEELCWARLALVTVIHLCGSARVAALLADLSDRFGDVHSDGSADLELPLSRRALAAATGLRAETVARSLRTLDKHGLAHARGRMIHIPSLDALLAAVRDGTLRAVA